MLEQIFSFLTHLPRVTKSKFYTLRVPPPAWSSVHILCLPKQEDQDIQNIEVDLQIRPFWHRFGKRKRRKKKQKTFQQHHRMDTKVDPKTTPKSTQNDPKLAPSWVPRSSILGFPVVFDQKEGHPSNSVVFIDPCWRPTWAPNFLFLLQDALKNPPERVQEAFFWETKIDLNIEGS